MKVTITVFNKYNQAIELILFGARQNLLKSNYGNNAGIHFTKIEADDEYKEKIGDFKDEHSNLSLFMSDCMRYNLVAVLINGKKIKKSPKYNSEFEMIEEEKEVEINTYSDEYKTLVFGGENKFEIVFKGSSSLRRKKMILLS